MKARRRLCERFLIFMRRDQQRTMLPSLHEKTMTSGTSRRMKHRLPNPHASRPRLRCNRFLQRAKQHQRPGGTSDAMLSGDWRRAAANSWMRSERSIKCVYTRQLSSAGWLMLGVIPQKLDVLQSQITDMRERCAEAENQLQETNDSCRTLLERAGNLRQERLVLPSRPLISHSNPFPASEQQLRTNSPSSHISSPVSHSPTTKPTR